MPDRVDPAQIRPILNLGVIIAVTMVIVAQIVSRFTNVGFFLPLWVVLPVAVGLLIVWRWVPSTPGSHLVPVILFLLGCCLLTALEGTGPRRCCCSSRSSTS